MSEWTECAECEGYGVDDEGGTCDACMGIGGWPPEIEAEEPQE